ncbi:MAG TPA: peptidase M20 [Desulfobacteraceae bacterium]|nr:peptidase M20 [Desulfobacteraceae bacterium]
MNTEAIEKIIEDIWETSAIPALKDYVAIPAKSPGFDPDWEANGYLMKALELAADWCRGQKLENADIRIVCTPGKSPVLLVEVGATGKDSAGDEGATTLFYGHLDKQPESEGWDAGKGPWIPVIEDGKLYGRGSADDGYAVFSAVSAIKALQMEGLSHGRCVILIETCEESGSFDLGHYLESLADVIGKPGLVVCLDSGTNDYERLWLTVSLRGLVAGTLRVDMLTRGVHSGGSGRAASSFRVMRQLLDRIEDAGTGEFLLPEYHARIPSDRLAQIRETAALAGDSIIGSIPLVTGARPLADTAEELLVNSSWKPVLSYIGADGFPSTATAGNVLRPFTSLKLSVRTPPTVDAEKAAAALKSVLEAEPPYGAKVSFDDIEAARGWNMPDMGDALFNRVVDTAEKCYGHKPAYVVQGGTIPLMDMLSRRLPSAKFLITGVLGPNANAHGPNEFLHLPYVKRLTAAVARIIAV